jgi:ACS family sodium-dependent inorganic phosphate cotransporter
MAESALSNSAPAPQSRWPQRYTVVALFGLATVLCYVDRVSISVAIIPLARDLGYDSARQGIVLSAFFWGYLLTQLLGGVVADRIGGKWALATGVAIWSLATFLTPPATAAFSLLLAMRVLLGLGEGVNFPAIHSLTARWIPIAERARMLSLNFSGMHVGTVTAFILSPPIIVAFGWPALFYITGAVGGIWVAVWIVRVPRHPPDSPAASSAASRDAAQDAHGLAARAPAIPWVKIAREKAVWAIVIAHFCSNFGYYILLLWLPTYLNYTFKVPLSEVGAYSLPPWIAAIISINAGGWIADSLLRRGMHITVVRKLMQSIAFTLSALPLLFVPTVESSFTAVVLVTISVAANGLGLAGFGVNHLDVGPNHAGILMGISNTVATVPGIVGVAAAGFIVQATGSFSAVFYLAAAIYLAGMFGYLAWATGERRL